MQVNQIDRAKLAMVLRSLYDLNVIPADSCECGGQCQIEIERDNATDGALAKEDCGEHVPPIGLRRLESTWVHARDYGILTTSFLGDGVREDRQIRWVRTITESQDSIVQELVVGLCGALTCERQASWWLDRAPRTDHENHPTARGLGDSL
jgi:hypothetical protein